MLVSGHSERSTEITMSLSLPCPASASILWVHISRRFPCSTQGAGLPATSIFPNVTATDAAKKGRGWPTKCLQQVRRWSAGSCPTRKVEGRISWSLCECMLVRCTSWRLATLQMVTYNPATLGSVRGRQRNRPGDRRCGRLGIVCLVPRLVAKQTPKNGNSLLFRQIMRLASNIVSSDQRIISEGLDAFAADD